MVEYAPPGASERKAIWEGLVAKGKVVTDESVDWDAVALKYELSGGFIKNALLAAVLFALARSKSTPIVSEQDVRRGCALQQRGAMHKHHALLGKKEDDDDSDASSRRSRCGRSVGASSNILWCSSSKGHCLRPLGLRGPQGAECHYLFIIRSARRRKHACGTRSRLGRRTYDVDARDALCDDAKTEQGCRRRWTTRACRMPYRS